MLCNFWGWIFRDLNLLLSALLEGSFFKTQTPCCKEAQATTWRGPKRSRKERIPDIQTLSTDNSKWIPSHQLFQLTAPAELPAKVKNQLLVTWLRPFWTLQAKPCKQWEVIPVQPCLNCKIMTKTCDYFRPVVSKYLCKGIYVSHMQSFSNFLKNSTIL